MITPEKRKLIRKKINQLPEKDLENVMTFIQSLETEKTDLETHFASEKALAKDWNKKEEEAWQDL